MIIDRVPVAGIKAYFQDTAHAGQVNLAPLAPVTVRTAVLGKGQQWEVSGVSVLLEGEDLLPLFSRQPEPLLTVSVTKEMFPTLFANPYDYRVHKISGFDDFERGEFENCRAIEIEGLPTLVSVGTGISRWRSRSYSLPAVDNLTSFERVTWELATSRLTPKNSFSYTLKLNYIDQNQTTNTVMLASDLDPTAPRQTTPAGFTGITSYQIEFEANVRNDSYVHEKLTARIGESIGRPLLRAVNLLEPVQSRFEVFSLNELLQLCSDFYLFDQSEGQLKRLMATLDFSATLVYSEQQDFPSDRYEFIEIAFHSDRFSNVELRLEADELIRPPND